MNHLFESIRSKWTQLANVFFYTLLLCCEDHLYPAKKKCCHFLFCDCVFSVNWTGFCFFIYLCCLGVGVYSFSLRVYKSLTVHMHNASPLPPTVQKWSQNIPDRNAAICATVIEQWCCGMVGPAHAPVRTAVNHDDKDPYTAKAEKSTITFRWLSFCVS